MTIHKAGYILLLKILIVLIILNLASFYFINRGIIDEIKRCQIKDNQHDYP